MAFIRTDQRPNTTNRRTLAYSESTTLLTCSRVPMAAPYVFCNKYEQRRGPEVQESGARQLPAHRIQLGILVLDPARRGTPCPRSSAIVWHDTSATSQQGKYSRTWPRRLAVLAQPVWQRSRSQPQSTAQRYAGGSAGGGCRTMLRDASE